MITPILDFGIAIVLAISMVLMISRLFIGPTLYDRVLAVNSFGTKTVLFLAVFSLMVGRGDGLDIALLYALINFIATIAILKFFRYRSFQVPLHRRPVTKAPTEQGGDNV